jgi:hypothetical protein
MKTNKYVKTQVLMPSHHPEFTKDPIQLSVSRKNFGNQEFSLLYECINKPGKMVMDHHKHDYDQYLNFYGGDPTHMLELNGELELYLSEDGKNVEKHIINKATSVWVPAGLYHCPLIFTRVDKPFLFIEVQFSNKYARTKSPVKLDFPDK